MNEVADRPEDLTQEWLSVALGKAVSGVRVEAIGTGQTAATFRLTLDADTLPPTLVAKLGAGDPAVRKAVHNGYRCEVGFYAELADTVEVRTPKCWYAAISDDGTMFTLILDDLAPLTPGVQIEGCTVAQASDAVRNLAGLHAARWNDETLFDLRFLRRPVPESAQFLGTYAQRATEQFVERYGPELDASDIETLRAAAAAIEPWLLRNTSPYTVLHGDYRLDNLLFPPEGDGVVVVDWQTLTVGLPARDLAYLLGTSLHTAERRAFEGELVAAYHAQLVARGVRDYELGRCFDDYRAGQLQGPLITTIGSANAASRDAAADGMFLAMAQRSCAAVRDLNTLEMR
jgi:hypothetical protein